MIDFSKIFENKSDSVFDNMDKVIKLITEADNPDDSQNEQEQEDPTMVDGQEEMAEQQEGDPADPETGVYISSNEKAALAKTMLDALQADPPKPGEIPNNLLNVTNTNADEVIKYVQSLLSLTNSVSLADDGGDAGLVDTLKES